MSTYTILNRKVEIFYSKEDEGHIANVPSLPRCSAFGETVEDAIKEIKTAIELRVEVMEDEKQYEVGNSSTVQQDLKYSSSPLVHA